MIWKGTAWKGEGMTCNDTHTDMKKTTRSIKPQKQDNLNDMAIHVNWHVIQTMKFHDMQCKDIH